MRQTPACDFSGIGYVVGGFGRAENRCWRKPIEESPNTAGRDAA